MVFLVLLTHPGVIRTATNKTMKRRYFMPVFFSLSDDIFFLILFSILSLPPGITQLKTCKTRIIIPYWRYETNSLTGLGPHSRYQASKMGDKMQKSVQKQNPVLYYAVGYSLIVDSVKMKKQLTETYPVALCLICVG